MGLFVIMAGMADSATLVVTASLLPVYYRFTNLYRPAHYRDRNGVSSYATARHTQQSSLSI
jgi:hypothetical protein